jgi:flagellar hook-associated protein 3 FlgL
MRITQSIIFNSIADSLQENLERLLQLNEQLASGKRIDKPSTDVVALSRAMAYKVDISIRKQMKRNMDDVVAYLQFSERTLSAAVETLTRVKELALTGVSGQEDATSRAAIAKEVMQLKKHLLGLANTKFRDRYIFSGYRTDIPAFNSITYDYEGDQGIINALIDRNTLVATNVPGSEAFAYSLDSTEVIQLEDGRYIYYIPGGGTTINVEIRDSDNTTVLDSFSFSNIIQMVNLLGEALDNNNLARIQALLKPVDKATDQLTKVRTELGARLNMVEYQEQRNEDGIIDLETLLSDTEDADIAYLVTEISKTEAALQALRHSSFEIINMSLLDFLR